MINLIQTTTEFAMYIASGYAGCGSVLIDATCGNGHDTLRLARQSPSKLYAFDVQQNAVSNTRALLIANGFEDKLADGTIELICDSHERMTAYVDRQADVICFNLGYLPGADKTNTTMKRSTMAAAAQALTLLKKGGLLCITIYSGHPEGMKEKRALLDWSQGLDCRQYHTAYISMPNQKNFPPEILLITRKL